MRSKIPSNYFLQAAYECSAWKYIPGVRNNININSTLVPGSGLRAHESAELSCVNHTGNNVASARGGMRYKVTPALHRHFTLPYQQLLHANAHRKCVLLYVLISHTRRIWYSITHTGWSCSVVFVHVRRFWRDNGSGKSSRNSSTEDQRPNG